MDKELELTLKQALDLGQRLLRADQLDEAQYVYEGVLANYSEQADALHYLGLLKQRRGDGDAALQLVKRSIEVAPGYAWMWNNLGNVLLQSQQADEALAAYRQCVALNPQAADALSNLGALHRKCGRLAEAEDACRRAVALQPGFALAWFNLAQVLIEAGRVREGLVANSKAIVLAPTHQTGRYQVARALVLLGEIERAAEVYRQWLADEPDNPLVLHHLAACEGSNHQRRAPDGYIEQVFDSFAVSFDAKLAGLGYRAPQLIAALLARRLPPPARQLQVADAGCGTGLCGPLIRAWAAHLVGFDLSAGMLKLAGERGVYDHLEKAELVDYLQRHPGAFDLVILADTLCYFGDLEEFSQAAFGALRPGGRLVFTVEAIADAEAAPVPDAATEARVDAATESRADAAAEPYRLQPHGRYAHSRDYVGTVFAAAGFRVEDLVQDVLRREAGLAVPGWLANVCKDAADRVDGG